MLPFPTANTTLIALFHHPDRFLVTLTSQESDLLPSVWPPSTKHLFTNFPRSVDSQPCLLMKSSTYYLLSLINLFPTYLLFYALLPKSPLQLVIMDIGRTIVWNPEERNKSDLAPIKLHWKDLGNLSSNQSAAPVIWPTLHSPHPVNRSVRTSM